MLASAVFASVFATVLAAAPPAPPAPPAAAPAAATTPVATTDFLPVDDKTWNATVQAHHGKVLLVNFWASYCLPCLEEMPDLLALAKKNAATLDVVFVNTDDPGSTAHVQAVLRRRKIVLPSSSSLAVVAADPTRFIQAIDPQWQGEVPATVLYTVDGKRHDTLIGQHSAAEIDAAIAAARAASAAQSRR
jgi:thiol-disulfide isomerase/thioredoxin